MYGTLFPIFICVSAVNSAPQEINTPITYVKLAPVTDTLNSTKESRIENIPVPLIDNTSDEDGERHGPDENGARNSEGDDNRSSNEEEKRGTSEENVRKARSDVTTANYESETAVTERDGTIEEVVDQTDDYESRTKPPAPRFISKLSYFKKDDFSSSVFTNLVETPGRRRFKSKCRCEKIWNCPKLQITVPRCPNEYFLCCF